MQSPKNENDLKTPTQLKYEMDKFMLNILGEIEAKFPLINAHFDFVAGIAFEIFEDGNQNNKKPITRLLKSFQKIEGWLDWDDYNITTKLNEFAFSKNTLINNLSQIPGFEDSKGSGLDPNMLFATDGVTTTFGAKKWDEHVAISQMRKNLLNEMIQDLLQKVIVNDPSLTQRCTNELLTARIEKLLNQPSSATKNLNDLAKQIINELQVKQAVNLSLVCN